MQFYVSFPFASPSHQLKGAMTCLEHERNHLNQNQNQKLSLMWMIQQNRKPNHHWCYQDLSFFPTPLIPVSCGTRVAARFWSYGVLSHSSMCHESSGH